MNIKTNQMKKEGAMQIELNGKVYEVEITTRKRTTWGERNMIGRVYVDMDRDVELDLCGARDHLEHTTRGEDADMDKAWDSYNAKYLTGCRDMMLLVWDVERSDLKFSRTAGCSCPCSPGFIVKAMPKGTDTWFTVKAVQNV